MTINFRIMSMLAAGLLSVAGLYAQDDSFDLSSQRSESQNINPVPGKKLDHGGMVINPVPHEISIDDSSFLPLEGGFRIKDRRKVFADELDFIRSGSTGKILLIDFGSKTASRHGVKPCTGAYVLDITRKGIAIHGYDEKGAFYGIQTLKQILESDYASNGKLPYMHVNDWPDLGYRGVVEGFYGTPWSHEVRLSLIDFYGRYKMNCYLYGPKDDPYHSSPDWRLPYPEDKAQEIRELVQACMKNRVDFIWAIHPGKDIKWNDEDYGNLLHKFELMYDLGVRSYALFFDDISGEGTNPVKHVELVNRLIKDFVEVREGVDDLIVCPTDYSKLWADPSPEGSLSIYGRTMDPSVELFWTGDVVCSDLTKETMQWFDSRIRRPGFYWWNYPVTDYARHILMQGPVYGLDGNMNSDDLSGFVSNPMEHGEASKLALYGVADYTWNVKAYNAIDNWERGLEVLAPEVKDAYRTFAIHSCDTETGYRRDESWETETFSFDTYAKEKADALLEEFEKIEKVPGIMESCSNGLLLNELRPWLTEFGKLGTRGRKAIECLDMYHSGNLAGFWNAYAANLMSEEDRSLYEAHKSGTLKLQPFYENLMDDMAAAFYEEIAETAPFWPRAIGTYPTLFTTQSKNMFDYDESTFFNSGDSQKEGHWIGADLGSVRPVKEVRILQGKTSVNDNDYFDHAVVEASRDGKTWTPLTEFEGRQYEVTWAGEPVEARYVRMRKLASDKTSWTVLRSFLVNPVPADCLAADENPFTAVHLDGKMRFEVPQGAYRSNVLMGDLDGKNVCVRIYDGSGVLLSDNVTSVPFVEVMIPDGAAAVELEGCADIYEVIFVR
jgi:hyaluronoglucosaminidase